MNKALTDLITISNTVGKHTSLVQGGGGNTSVKTDDGKYMYIKASGTALKNMDAKTGWRRMNVASVLDILQDKKLSKMQPQQRETEVVHQLLLACEDDVKSESRPSVEAHLHALLGKCVIHLHPTTVGAYVNAKRGKQKLDRLFANDKYPPLWIPYTDPGFRLAKRIAKRIGEYEATYHRKPAVFFLEKHGLLVSAETPNAALRLVKKTVKTCESNLKKSKSAAVKTIDPAAIRSAKLAIRKAYFEAAGNYEMVHHFNDEEIAAFNARRDCAKLLRGNALNPDELVYANGPALYTETANADSIAKKMQKQIERGQQASLAVLVKKLGLFVIACEKMAPITCNIVKSSLFIRSHANSMGGIYSLTKAQQQFVREWESESARKAHYQSGCIGEVQGQIAVVTGAGSGLGKSIAVGLARAGAHVAVADIDETAAQQTCDTIRKQLPGASTETVKCNVTDEQSVITSFQNLLDKWGGLDIVVNAAGVAPAYSLVDLPVDKWRFALEVNLTGYFLMAREAAKIMIEQNLGGSIVCISSKSGLEASKKNTPYNASKAGEIHMARGWAMELGEHGIRVNNVCPGNVFEGSKIWNPTYIKTCAKKYGIRPEEVIPYYVNKTILQREIKGQDIADSVVFLCSDKARCITGQTVVTDSGQVLVR